MLVQIRIKLRPTKCFLAPSPYRLRRFSGQEDYALDFRKQYEIRVDPAKADVPLFLAGK